METQKNRRGKVDMRRAHSITKKNDPDLPRDLSELDFTQSFDMHAYLKMIQRGFPLEPRFEEIA